MPSRTPFAAFAVARTVVLPIRATTAPCDCKANLPVSNDRVLSVPETAPLTEMASAMIFPFVSAPLFCGLANFCAEQIVGSQLETSRRLLSSAKCSTDNQRQVVRLFYVLFICFLLI